MLNRGIAFVAVLTGIWDVSLAAEAPKKRVLVVTLTMAYRHPSIPTAEKVLAKLADESGLFSVSFARVDPANRKLIGKEGQLDIKKWQTAIQSELKEKMSRAALTNYDAIVFANTTGELPLPDKQALLDFVSSGKGFVGMHAAS